MEPAYLILALHITCTAVWFGNNLTVPGRLRRAIAAGLAEAKFAAEEGIRSARVSFIFGVATFVTGMLVIMQRGGFAQVRKPIHWSMGLVAAMIAIDVVTMQIWKKISQTASSGAQADALGGFKGKLAMLSGIQQLLWLVVLYWMVAKF